MECLSSPIPPAVEESPIYVEKKDNLLFKGTHGFSHTIGKKTKFWDAIVCSKIPVNVEMFDCLTLGKRKSDSNRYIFVGAFTVKMGPRRKDKKLLLVFDINNPNVLFKITMCDVVGPKKKVSCEKRHKKVIEK